MFLSTAAAAGYATCSDCCRCVYSIFNTRYSNSIYDAVILFFFCSLELKYLCHIFIYGMLDRLHLDMSAIRDGHGKCGTDYVVFYFILLALLLLLSLIVSPLTHINTHTHMNKYLYLLSKNNGYYFLNSLSPLLFQ